MEKKSENRRSGFTLLETLIGVAIFVVISGALTLFSRNVWVYSSIVTGGLVDVSAGRQVIKSMTSEVRTASTADTGAYSISQATASSFTFYSNIDKDALKEKVRYFVTGKVLQKGVIKPTGSPPTYNALNEKISILTVNVNNVNIFTFYDKFYDGSQSALAFPVNIADIRLVKINVLVDQDPNRSPLPITFTTQVSIRNLKDNL